jgi:hypothetical protein
MKSARAILVSVLFMTAFFGCAQHVALMPSPDAESRMVSENEAAASAEGVEVSANGNAWPGKEDIWAVVTPVKVTIRNGSGVPLRINYRSFRLVDAAGNRYAALPPFAIDESIAEAKPYHPARGYYAAPFYPPLYPHFSPFWGDPFFYDPLYYNSYYGSWRRVELPTPEMLERALAEGVLEDGTRTEGFLYFERIDADTPRVIFEAEFTDARRDEAFAVMEIPFTVVER